MTQQTMRGRGPTHRRTVSRCHTIIALITILSTSGCQLPSLDSTVKWCDCETTSEWTPQGYTHSVTISHTTYHREIE